MLVHRVLRGWNEGSLWAEFAGPPYKGLIMTAKRLSERIQMRAEFAGVASNIVVIKDIHRQHFVLSFFFP